jgi:RsiW-degrading membrane proteinase PrsW (M82 family)
MKSNFLTKCSPKVLMFLVGGFLCLVIIAAYYLYIHMQKWESIPTAAYPSFLGRYRSIFFIATPGEAILSIYAGILSSRDKK